MNSSESPADLLHFTASRYVQPLREGGSLPAIVDTEAGLFVAKFRGAGQGARALIAELIAGLLARALGLPVPELAIIEVLPVFGRAEPDPEIQDLLRASHGINFGMRYLDGAFNYDPNAASDLIESSFAAEVVWLDAFLTNPDRTHRNPNLMIWNRKAWLIDHGAALYVHHDWSAVDEARIRSPFAPIRDHVLLARATDLEDADARLAARVTPGLLRGIMAAVPDALLLDAVSRSPFAKARAARDRYVDYLTDRLAHRASFVQEAVRARDAAAAGRVPGRTSSRR